VHKILYVLMDGVGDRPVSELGNRTPLEAARTPNIDFFAGRSRLGLVYPVSRGVAPASDVAAFSMLGYKVLEGYVGRGVVEALGCGLDFRDGDLALRGNFASVDEEFRIVDRRARRDITQEENSEFTREINENLRFDDPNVEFVFKGTIAHRAVLLIRYRGMPLSSNVSNTDPAYTRVRGVGVVGVTEGVLRLCKSEPLDDSPEADLSAKLLNEFTQKVFRILSSSRVNEKRVRDGKLPANIVLLRDPSNSAPKLKPFSELHLLKAAMIADMPVELGVAKAVGMDTFVIGGINDYEVKAEGALSLLERYDMVCVHLKGPDEPGHDGNFIRKREAVEKIDAEFFGVIRRIADGNVAIAVSSDHATPCSTRSHSDDPVPLMVYVPGKAGDSAGRFAEKDAVTGSLGLLLGCEVLPTVLKLVRDP